METSMSSSHAAARLVGQHAAMPAHPVMCHVHPDDVLEDAALRPEEKRSILASWASDANAVDDRPWLRQTDSGFQVPVREIMEALKRLDGRTSPRRPGRRSSDDDDDDPPPTPAGAGLPPNPGQGGEPARLMELLAT